MGFVGDGDTTSFFHFKHRVVKILGLLQGPRVRATVGIEKERLVVETFLDLLLQGIQVLADGSARDEIAAKNLRHPAETAFLEQTQKRRAIRNEAEGNLDGFVADLAPAGQIVLIAERAIYTPKMPDEFKLHSLGKRYMVVC